MNFDFTGRLPALRLPTLVVCGADDPGTPPSENCRLAGLVPGGRYEEVADARHFPNVKRPEAFNRVLIGWPDAQPHARDTLRRLGENNENPLFAMESPRWQHISVLRFQ